MLPNVVYHTSVCISLVSGLIEFSTCYNDVLASYCPSFFRANGSNGMAQIACGRGSEKSR